MDPTTQFLVTEKLKSFNNICTLCMAWWTSSVVFSAAIVSGVWLKKKQILGLPHFRLLGVAIAVFFLSLVIFGGFIFAYTFYIDDQLSRLLATVGKDRDLFHGEVFLLRLSIADAVSSFLLIIAAWIVLWRTLSRDRRPVGYWVTCYRSVSDEATLASYAKVAGPAIKAGGGRFLARGIPVRVYENGLSQRLVIIEFDSTNKAIEAYESPEYQAALAVLKDAAERDVRII